MGGREGRGNEVGSRREEGAAVVMVHGWGRWVEVAVVEPLEVEKHLKNDKRNIYKFLQKFSTVKFSEIPILYRDHIFLGNGFIIFSCTIWSQNFFPKFTHTGYSNVCRILNFVDCKLFFRSGIPFGH